MASTIVEYDPFGVQMQGDPYPAYRLLREHAPLYHNAERDLWMLSRHDDVVAATADWATFSSAAGADTDNLGAYFSKPGNFFDSDPEPHDLLRGVLHSSFMPRNLVPRLTPIVQEAVEDLLGALADREEADLAEDYGWALPVRVTAELLGLPREDLPLLRRWADSVFRRIPGVPVPPPAAREALVEVGEYLRTELARRRQASVAGEDLLAVIADARLNGAPLVEEGVGMATLIFLAGIETPASMIGNALLLLAQHPDQRSWLREHPDGIPNAIEEVLRFDCPAQHVRRITTRDVEIHGHIVPQGAFVVMLYGSANRDERRWAQPDRFDVARESMRHLAFGNGIHHCLGAPLARLMGARALEAVLRDLPDYEIAGPVVRFPSHMDRGLQSLPVRQKRSGTGRRGPSR
jgi:cytochrome P450